MDELGEFVELQLISFIAQKRVTSDVRKYLFWNWFRRPSEPITLYYLDNAGHSVYQHFRPVCLRKRPDDIMVVIGVIVRGQRKDMQFTLLMDPDADTAGIGYAYPP